MKIALTYNLERHKTTITNDEEAEFDDQETINGIKHAIQTGGHLVTLIEANELAFIKLRKLRRNIDLVFNIAEGTHGEARESLIPAYCDFLGLPYTGSGPLTLAICLNKALTKRLLQQTGIPVAPFQLFHDWHEPLQSNLKFPLFIKPNYEGSSKGILNDSVIRNVYQLKNKLRKLINRYHQDILVEEYLPGREFTVSILGNGQHLLVLPIYELCFDDLLPNSNPIDSYESKHLWPYSQSTDALSHSAIISKQLEKKMHSIARTTFQVLNCYDLARIDIRLDANRVPHVLEVNPLPDIGNHGLSGFIESAELGGYSYNSLINKIITLAIRRYKLTIRTKHYVSKKGKSSS